MTHRLFFVVPGPPVPLARPRVWRDGNGESHAKTPTRCQQYKRHVASFALRARQIENTAMHKALYGEGVKWPLDARYKLDVAIYRTARRGDADNYLKSVADSLQRVLYNDDRQVVDKHVRVFEDRARPRAEITIEVVS